MLALMASCRTSDAPRGRTRERQSGRTRKDEEEKEPTHLESHHFDPKVTSPPKRARCQPRPDSDRSPFSSLHRTEHGALGGTHPLSPSSARSLRPRLTRSARRAGAFPPLAHLTVASPPQSRRGKRALADLLFPPKQTCEFPHLVLFVSPSNSPLLRLPTHALPPPIVDVLVLLDTLAFLLHMREDPFGLFEPNGGEGSPLDAGIDEAVWRGILDIEAEMETRRWRRLVQKLEAQREKRKAQADEAAR